MTCTDARGRMTDMMDSQRERGLNVHVEVPDYVRAGDTVELKCKYDLGSDTLYAVKWYKGKNEFYRYTPKERPDKQAFPVQGLQINVSSKRNVHISKKNMLIFSPLKWVNRL